MILIVAGAAVLGKALPLVPDVHQAIIVVSVLGVLKLMASAVHRLLWI